MEPLRVACLYRVSSKKQMDENDIPMQKKACKNFIKTMSGWNLVKEYSEKGVSGYHKSADQRDVLQQIKKDAENKAFDVLLVFMFDRLGRREDETPFIVEWFVAKGIQVWSVKEGRQTFDNRADKLLNYIRFWQSGGESEKTSIRVSEKHKQMVEEGKFRGGVAPYGYKLVQADTRNKKGYELKKLDINPIESQIVEKIFHLAAVYGYGGFKIANYLNERNISTKRGNYWTAYSVNNLLKNPIYKGYYVSGKRRNERGQRKRMPPEEWIFSNRKLEELAIVDEAIWNKAEKIRLSRQPGQQGQYPQQTKGPLLFVGLLKCGYCGATMCSRYAVKKWVRKKDGQEIKYIQPKYICQKRNQQKPCDGQTTYSQQKLEPLILEEVNIFLHFLQGIDISEKTKEKYYGRIEKSKAEVTGLAAAMAEVTRELCLLNNEIIQCLSGSSSFTKEQLSALIQQKEAELEMLTIESEKKRHYLTDLSQKSDALNSVNTIPDWEKVFEACPTEIKKIFLADIIEKIHVYRDRIQIYFKYNVFM